MANFGNISAQEVKADVTRELTLQTIEPQGTVVLVVRPGTQQNKGYADGKLKKLPTVERAQSGVGLTTGILEKLQTVDRGLIARFIIVDWRNVVDSDGKPVPFTPENAVDFCNALPTRTLTEIARFCEQADNFVDPADAAPTPGQTEAFAKN